MSTIALVSEITQGYSVPITDEVPGFAVVLAARFPPGAGLPDGWKHARIGPAPLSVRGKTGAGFAVMPL